MRPVLGILSPLWTPLDYLMEQIEFVLWIGFLLYSVVKFAQLQARVVPPSLSLLLLML